MAIIGTPEASKGIMGAIRGALGIFGDTNKEQGVEAESRLIPLDEYESTLTEEEILKLTSEWKKLYQPYNYDIDKSQRLAFNYWVGLQRSEEYSNTANLTTMDKNVIDNRIFQSIETFLPIATRANPDPLVSADPSEVGQQISKDVKVGLVNWADTQKLRRKLAKMTRHWAIYRIGVGKLVWDVAAKEIKLEIINPRRFVFDKDGYIDEGGHYKGAYLGEKKQMVAEDLIKMFPKKATEIRLKAGKKLGTKLEFYEWWYCGHRQGNGTHPAEAEDVGET